MPLKVNAISASSYIVMDTDNNRVLEGSNINKRSLIASITKIMTSMVVIDMTNVNKTVTIGDEVLKSFGSGIYVSVGEKISVINLLYGLMLRSGNDAAIALAYYTAGNMDNFAYLMNNKAKDIGMNNTTFVNSSGLEDGSKANYEIINSFVTTTKDIIGIKSKEDIYYIKNSDIPIMDKESTGSVILKTQINDVFKVKELKLINDEDVKEEPPKEEKIQELTIDDFLEDFKL